MRVSLKGAGLVVACGLLLVQAAGAPNSGSWDMNAVNETGRHKGRFLFTVFETGQSGVQRHDLLEGRTETIWQSPAPGGHVSFDPCYWMPWGTLITAEESWETAAMGSTSPYGRLFELKNPLHAPGLLEPLTPESNENADFVHRNVIPRTSHEGIQFDKAGNMYFIDELNGGNIYKFTSAAKLGKAGHGADYIVEDRGGADDDIWFARDRNHNGDLTDADEGLERWASNGTPGSEFTGLYFDPYDKRRAWVNIQHPASANDRTIEITIPHHGDDEDDDR